MKHSLIRNFDRFHTDPSGSYWETNAKAIGSGSEGADTALTDHYNRVSHYYAILYLLLVTFWHRNITWGMILQHLARCFNVEYVILCYTI